MVGQDRPPTMTVTTMRAPAALDRAFAPTQSAGAQSHPTPSPSSAIEYSAPAAAAAPSAVALSGKRPSRQLSPPPPTTTLSPSSSSPSPSSLLTSSPNSSSSLLDLNSLDYQLELPTPAVAAASLISRVSTSASSKHPQAPHFKPQSHSTNNHHQQFQRHHHSQAAWRSSSSTLTSSAPTTGSATRAVSITTTARNGIQQQPQLRQSLHPRKALLAQPTLTGSHQSLAHHHHHLHHSHHHHHHHQRLHQQQTHELVSSSSSNQSPTGANRVATKSHLITSLAPHTIHARFSTPQQPLRGRQAPTTTAGVVREALISSRRQQVASASSHQRCPASSTVTNSRVRQGVLYARRHQYPPPVQGPCRVISAALRPLASQQLVRAAETSQSLGCIGRSSHSSSGQTNFSSTSTTTKTTFCKTSSRFSLNSSTSSLSLTAVKRVKPSPGPAQTKLQATSRSLQFRCSRLPLHAKHELGSANVVDTIGSSSLVVGCSSSGAHRHRAGTGRCATGSYLSTTTRRSTTSSSSSSSSSGGAHATRKPALALADSANSNVNTTQAATAASAGGAKLQTDNNKQQPLFASSANIANLSSSQSVASNSSIGSKSSSSPGPAQQKPTSATVEQISANIRHESCGETREQTSIIDTSDASSSLLLSPSSTRSTRRSSRLLSSSDNKKEASIGAASFEACGSSTMEATASNCVQHQQQQQLLNKTNMISSNNLSRTSHEATLIDASPNLSGANNNNNNNNNNVGDDHSQERVASSELNIKPTMSPQSDHVSSTKKKPNQTNKNPLGLHNSSNIKQDKTPQAANKLAVSMESPQTNLKFSNTSPVVGVSPTPGISYLEHAENLPPPSVGENNQKVTDENTQMVKSSDDSEIRELSKEFSSNCDQGGRGPFNNNNTSNKGTSAERELIDTADIVVCDEQNNCCDARSDIGSTDSRKTMDYQEEVENIKTTTSSPSSSPDQVDAKQDSDEHFSQMQQQSLDSLDSNLGGSVEDHMVLGSPIVTPPPSELEVDEEEVDHMIDKVGGEQQVEVTNNTDDGLLSVNQIPDIPIITEPIDNYYHVETKPFARGKFAQVKRCISKSPEKQCFAAKCIKKRRRSMDLRHEILLEIEALKLSYLTSRIIKLYQVFETATEMILVLEMANGGELQRVLDDEEAIEEKLVKQMVRQILEGLIQLHDSNIAHLDIKPQNLLLSKAFPDGDIKLCDFGISRRISKGCEIREICGTPDYVAPEILRYDPISLATDMWSLGVLTYVLLTGYSPFGSESKQQTFCNITQAKLDFPSEIFDTISQEAIDFMRKLMLREPAQRLTSRQARAHPWLSC